VKRATTQMRVTGAGTGCQDNMARTKPIWSRLAAMCVMTVPRRLRLVGKGKSHLYGFALFGYISKAAGVVQAHSHLIERAGHQVDSRDARGDRHLHQRRHEQTRDAHAAIELPGHNKTDIGKEPVRIYPYLRKIVDTHIVQPIGTWAVVSEHLDGVWSTRPALRGRVVTRTLAGHLGLSETGHTAKPDLARAAK
jgi:hypothetical protein